MLQDSIKAIQILPKEEQQALRRSVRVDLAGFYTIYMQKETFKPMSAMHIEMFNALQNPDISLMEIMGFRGCAKSTIGALAYPLWAALEHPELYPFIILIYDTAQQASLGIAAIQHELEENAGLKADYGDMKPADNREDWQSKNMVLVNGVRIMAVSRGQKIRGFRHRQHRPKLIIVDDPEDLEWVQSDENRNKTERWFLGEVVPAADARQRKIVLIGNMLHNDSLIARIRRNHLFTVYQYPIVSDDGICLWPEMYPTQKDLETQRDTVRPIAWQREYMLRVAAEEGQDVHEEDIEYYDELPFNDGNHLAHGGDLAISTKESADYTAIVTGEVTYTNKVLEIYVYPHPVIRRMNFHDTIGEMDNIRKSHKMFSEFYVEAVAYQMAAIEEMERRGFSVEAMKPIKDKRSRLRVAARYIKNGTVKFPRTGCEDLLNQLLNFGIEKHDDAVDALVWLILGVVGAGIDEPEVHFI